MITLALTIWLFTFYRDYRALKKRLKDHEIVTLANTKGIMNIVEAIENHGDRDVIH